MDIYELPAFLGGDDKAPVNIHFYLRENADHLDKLKLKLTQNMLSLMIKGRKEVVEEKHRLSIDSNQLLLIPAGNILMSERTTINREYESMIIFFSNEFLEQLMAKHHILTQSHSTEKFLVLVLDKDDYLVNFQQSMKLLKHGLEKLSLQITKTEEILLYLLQKYPKKMRGFISNCMTKGHDNPLVNVVQKNLFINLSYEELAFLCNMSVSTFKRRFYEMYGTTPKKYFVNKKMQMAEFMLQNKKRPSDIYYELGYKNLSSFSLEFKKYYGYPPKVLIAS